MNPNAISSCWSWRTSAPERPTLRFRVNLYVNVGVVATATGEGAATAGTAGSLTVDPELTMHEEIVRGLLVFLAVSVIVSVQLPWNPSDNVFMTIVFEPGDASVVGLEQSPAYEMVPASFVENEYDGVFVDGVGIFASSTTSGGLASIVLRTSYPLLTGLVFPAESMSVAPFNCTGED